MSNAAVKSKITGIECSPASLFIKMSLETPRRAVSGEFGSRNPD